MNKRSELMEQIMQYDFALKELQLYLDTHPDCRHALDKFAELKPLRDAAVSEYSENYSPLTPDITEDNSHWNWCAEPFPWEV